MPYIHSEEYRRTEELIQKIQKKRDELTKWECLTRTKAQDLGESTRMCEKIQAELNELYRQKQSEETPPQVP